MFDKILKNINYVSSYIQGVHAENRALKYLESLGMNCLAKRFKTSFGEIDLLMQDNHTIVAVEVKYRKSLSQAVYSIKPKQQLRIQQALEYWICQHEIYKNTPPFQRFDVVLVCPGYEVSYYRNAWIS